MQGISDGKGSYMDHAKKYIEAMDRMDFEQAIKTALDILIVTTVAAILLEDYDADELFTSIKEAIDEARSAIASKKSNNKSPFINMN